jgi:hypothetical protein
MIDPRGQRFAATLSAVVLAVVLLTGSTWLLLAQAAVFAVGAFAGPARTPYAWVFRTFVRPRIGAPAQTEHPAPPRFAQLCGLAFTGVALLGVVLGVPALTVVAVSAALAAAFLNAAFGLCLGCEVYLRLRRAGMRVPRRPQVRPVT